LRKDCSHGCSICEMILIFSACTTITVVYVCVCIYAIFYRLAIHKFSPVIFPAVLWVVLPISQMRKLRPRTVEVFFVVLFFSFPFW
jgi:hypothetical protein